MSLTLTLERGGGEVSGSGTNIELDGTIAGGAIESVEMYGDTEQQTYSGKNLFQVRKTTQTQNNVTFTYNGDGTFNISASTPASAGTEFSVVVPLSESGIVSGQKYTLSSDKPVGTASDSMSYWVHGCDSGGTWVKSLLGFTSAGTQTAQEPTTQYVKFVVNVRAGFSSSYTNVKTQMELGSTATSFEPYVGGTASPNPDYPQEVKTVTGEQTITISDGNGQSQSYTVDLGDIELCKIGTYQDKIYKSGEDWYVRKEIEKKTISSEDVSRVYNYTNIDYARVAKPITSVNYNNYNEMQYPLLCTHASHILTTGSWDTTDRIGRIYASASANDYWIGFLKGTSSDDMKTILNGAMIYYILATPTDTQITNSALIAQLEALNEATTYDGTTIITVSSENLAGPLEVKVSSNIAKTYTEVEIGSPFTITDVEGKSSNTTLDGNVYVDWAYNKKQYSFDLFNLTPQDYADIRAFYDYQFSNSAFPTITVPELNIDKLPVYMEISSRNIINQCLLTDKLTIKFRETVQP